MFQRALRIGLQCLRLPVSDDASAENLLQENLEPVLGEPPAIRNRTVDSNIEWRRDEQNAFVPQNAANLLDRRKRIQAMLQDFHAHDAVVLVVVQAFIPAGDVADDRRLVGVDLVERVDAVVRKEVCRTQVVLRTDLEQSARLTINSRDIVIFL